MKWSDLADVFTEYAISFRLGSRTRSGESYADETSYFSGEILTATLAKAYIPDGVTSARCQSRGILARVICSTNPSRWFHVRSGRNPKFLHSSPTSATCRCGDYVVHVEHGIGQYQGLKEINQGDGNAEFMLLEYAEGARLYVPLTRLDLIQKYRSSEGASLTTQSSGHRGVDQDQSSRPQSHEGHDGRAAQALRRAQDRARATPFARQRMDAGVRRRLRIQRN